jgi:putative alpha-1,2-mannosidase
MGFYPVCPGTNEYVTGTPMFEKMTVKLENGKRLEIKASNQSRNNFYIRKIELNGKPATRNLIHERLLEGGVLSFEMTGDASMHGKLTPVKIPYSLSNDESGDK